FPAASAHPPHGGSTRTTSWWPRTPSAPRSSPRPGTSGFRAESEASPPGSLRRRFALAQTGVELLLAVTSGWSSWNTTRRALERELDEKLVWVAGAAAEVGLQGNLILQLRPGDEGSRLYTAPREQLLGLLRYVDEAHVFRRDHTLL